MTEQTTNKSAGIRVIRLVIILLCGIIGGGVGFSTQYWLPNKPQLEVKISVPKAADLGNYSALYATYQFVTTGSQQDISARLQTEIFTEFNRALQQDLFRQFLAKQNVIAQWANFQHQTAQQTAQIIAQSLQVQPQGEETLIQFNLPFANTAMGGKLLTDFLAVSATQTKEKLYADLVHKWKNLFQQVKSAAENLAEPQQKQAQLGKLKIMQSVQSLDNQLVAFNYIENVHQVEKYRQTDILIGALIGCLFGALFGMMLVRVRV